MMDFFTGLIPAPRADYLLLNRFIIIGMSALFLFYISLLFGSLFFSLMFNSRARSENDPISGRFSKDLIDTFIGNKTTGIILGILPAIVLLITLSQNLYDTAMPITRDFFYVVILTSVGYIFAHLFKASMLKEESNYQRQQLLGTIAVLSLVLMIFVFISSTGLVLFPSRWSILKWPLPIFFDFNIVVRFLMFFASAFAIIGSTIIFFFFNWDGGKEGMGEEYENFVLKFGGGVSLGAAIMLGLLLVWDFKTFPEVALGGAYKFSLLGFPVSINTYVIALTAVFLLMVISLMLYSILTKSDVGKGSQVFILLIITVIALSANDNLARDTALTEHNLYLHNLTEEFLAEVELQRSELRGSTEPDAAMGEKIFNTKCFACHKFDQRLVGPAYAEVLPKYENDMEALVNFVLNPVKIDNEYPIMPNQGLKPVEARSVAKYIMDKYLAEYK
jgi:cytochrome c551/c552